MTFMAVEARANNQYYLKHQVSICNLYFFFVIFSFCLVFLTDIDYLIPLNNSAVYVYTYVCVIMSIFQFGQTDTNLDCIFFGKNAGHDRYRNDNPTPS